MSFESHFQEMDKAHRNPRFGGFHVVAIWDGKPVQLSDELVGGFYWNASSDPDGALSPDAIIGKLAEIETKEPSNGPSS